MNAEYGSGLPSIYALTESVTNQLANLNINRVTKKIEQNVKNGCMIYGIT